MPTWARPTPNRASRLLASAVAVALVGVAAVAGRAISAPALPSVDAEQLVASVVRAAATDPNVSGEVLVHIDLGIPSLPELPGGPGGLATYLSGDHRARVWRTPAAFRVSELLPAAERSLIVTPAGAWTWDSATFTATRLGPFPAGAGPSGEPDGPAGIVRSFDPIADARHALALVGPSTNVRIGPAVRVAGRDAYDLVLEPRTADTLVGRIEVAIDAQTRLPLRVAAFARNANTAALSVGFTSVSFGAIDPSVFRFSPPAGATVNQVAPPRRQWGLVGRNAKVERGPLSMIGGAQTFGRDWVTVLALRVPPVSVLFANAASIPLERLLPFSGALLSVRLADRGDHGWLLVGAVPQTRLAALERSLP